MHAGFLVAWDGGSVVDWDSIPRDGTRKTMDLKDEDFLKMLQPLLLLLMMTMRMITMMPVP